LLFLSDLSTAGTALSFSVARVIPTTANIQAHSKQCTPHAQTSCNWAKSFAWCTSHTYDLGLHKSVKRYNAGPQPEGRQSGNCPPEIFTNVCIC